MDTVRVTAIFFYFTSKFKWRYFSVKRMFAVLMAMLSIAFTCQWNGCEGKPKREYASLILYDNYQGEWVFDHILSVQEEEVEYDEEKFYHFEVDVLWESGVREHLEGDDKLRVSFNYYTPEGEYVDNRTEIHRRGTYRINAFIPNHHEKLEPFTATLVMKII